MNVNRSGYYKWLKNLNKPNRYEKLRQNLYRILIVLHNRKKSKGYHALAHQIREEERNSNLVFSDNLIHKCCKYLGIKSCVRRYKYRKPGNEHVVFKNLVRNNWTPEFPLKLVASDMTNIKYRGRNYEWTYLLDLFNNEIISSHLSGKHGDPLPYYRCLDDLKKKIEKQTTPTVLHTDQGAVYSSRAFQRAHKNYNIIRSMSRAGTPTDNPVIEALNGWIKDGIATDYDINAASSIKQFIEQYVYYFNNQRIAYALNYKTPAQYKIELGFG